MSDVRHWLTFPALMGAVLGTVSACPLIDDPNHCANMAQSPCLAAQVCDPCASSSGNNGCVAEGAQLDQDPQTPGCQAVGGATTVDATETDVTATTTMDPTVTTTVDVDTTVTAGETESTSTGIPVECMDPDGMLGDGCPDNAPFCVDGTCTPCTESPTDCATAEAPGGDVCDSSGRCVECNDQDAMACGGNTPICDAEGFSCVACTAHDQCAGGAGCHLFVGSCLPEDAVIYASDTGAGCSDMTGGDSPATPKCSLSAAIDDVPVGSEATIRMAAGTYVEDISIPANSVVAVIANDDATITADNGNPSVRVLDGTTAYLADLSIQNILGAGGVESAGDVRLDRVTIQSSGVGLLSTGGAVFVESTRIINNSSTGVSLGGTDQATLRNVILAANGAGTSPRGFVTTAATPFDIIYSTIADNAGTNGGAINSPSGVGNIRNSIIVSGSLTNSIGVTTTITVENSLVADDDFSGEPGNFSVGDVGDILFDGNYEIPVGSIAADVAVWMNEDPLTDINGVMRPAMDGSMDYAGADLPD